MNNAGWVDAPEWLDVKSVLSGGHKRGLVKQRAAYREYVESVLGQGLPESPIQRIIEEVFNRLYGQT